MEDHLGDCIDIDHGNSQAQRKESLERLARKV